MSGPDLRNLDTGDVADDVTTTTCAACPHPWSDHDRIAVRFCTATAAGALGRGCVCTAYANGAGSR